MRFRVTHTLARVSNLVHFDGGHRKAFGNSVDINCVFLHVCVCDGSRYHFTNNVSQE